jgi:hypothetical protein
MTDLVILSDDPDGIQVEVPNHAASKKVLTPEMVNMGIKVGAS